jgi:hypothetical protein
MNRAAFDDAFTAFRAALRPDLRVDLDRFIETERRRDPGGDPVSHRAFGLHAWMTENILPTFDSAFRHDPGGDE